MKKETSNYYTRDEKKQKRKFCKETSNYYTSSTKSVYFYGFFFFLEGERKIDYFPYVWTLLKWISSPMLRN